MDVGNLEALAQFAVVGMVGDHHSQIGGKLPGRPPDRQVGQAVGLARGQNGHGRAVLGEADGQIHLKRFGYRLTEGILDVPAVKSEPVQVELDALEEHSVDGVDVLVGVENVAAMTEQEVGHRGHDAPPIGT